MKRQIYLLALMVMSTIIYGQDPVFSQYYNAPLQLNPALAGNSLSPFLSANVRVQWPGLSNAYNTYSLSYDQDLKNTNAAFGLNLLNDSAGDGVIKHTKVNGVYAYKLRIKSGHYIRGGLELGMIQKRLDWGKLVFGDAIDPQFGAISPGGSAYPSAEVQPSNLNKTVLDASVGLVYASPTTYVGVSVNHLNNPSDEFLTNEEKNYPGIAPRYTLHAGYQFSIEEGNKIENNTFIVPNMLFTAQGGFTQINASIYAQVRSLLLSTGYRVSNSTGDALIFGAGYRMHDWKMMYSFDFTTSTLGISQGGAHEISIIYNIPTRDDSKRDVQNCLNIFR